MNVTRGHGLLENFLALQRTKIVGKNIPVDLRAGKILDIGCGYFPFFLSRVRFKEKFGIDKDFGENLPPDVDLVKQNLAQEKHLPFADNFFDVITILAVLEHMPSSAAIELLKEAKRALKRGGKLFLTVPRDHGDKLLRILSKLGLVSKIEISEHVQLYNPANLAEQLIAAGFKKENIRIKSFELGLNLFISVES